MYFQPSEWSNSGSALASEPRSIGSILRAIPEVAALKATKHGHLRNLALRGNSA